ncbi:hypothetical protein [Plasmodium yoelii yoelii]|uniref:Uncharacterized protein n=1 Tax=Plasmodium yoelii yoelii TaxID=73239 RepID=Q7RQU2_PLAYO|nr:hypothetical protein [Plasmodium yoelii yoelii]
MGELIKYWNRFDPRGGY